MKTLHVVGAAIVNDCNEILCARRGKGRSLEGYWEFPGGKIEDEETPQEALKREIFEELHCTIEVGEKVCTVEHHYDFGIVELSVYMCRLANGTPRKTEHAELRWVARADIGTLTWAPADTEPVAKIACGTRTRADHF